MLVALLSYAVAGRLADYADLPYPYTLSTYATYTNHPGSS
jgi:hypothetical protein